MTRSLLLLLCTLPACGAAAQTRPLSVDDLFAIKELDAPHVSPEGKWPAYTVESLDPGKDESDKDVWMAPLAGGEPVRVTSSPKSESMPRFSPDGRYLAFLSGRDGKKTQVWLLDRQGGEAQRLTAFPRGVSALARSPDATRLALVVSDPDPDEPEPDDAQDANRRKTPKPIVLRRLTFKSDGDGYLKELRSQLHLFDLRTRASAVLTSGPYDVSSPAWSPDARLIAFVTARPRPTPTRTPTCS